MLMNIRRIDSLGRIVIPKEMRDKLNWKERVPGESDGDVISLICQNGEIKLTKIVESCIFCGCSEQEDLIEVDGIKVCNECIKKLWENINKNIEK